MKKLILLSISLVLSLNAQVIKENVLDKIQKQKQKSSLEADLLKDSWIAPVELGVNITKNRFIDKTYSTSKKAYLNFEQDIFKSGGIYYTIKKGKVSQNLAKEQFTKDLNTLKVALFKNVLELKVLDLKIKQQEYLIKNKTLEVEKKQEQYLNSLIDIEDLDTAIIEKNDLLNQIEDLNASKDEYEKALQKQTKVSYLDIDIQELKIIPLREYLNENQELIIQKLNSKISKYDKQIKDSSYLPKVSLFSQVGYEDNSSSGLEDNYYNYGAKITIPLDYNMNKNKEIARVDYLLSKLEENIKKDDEEIKYKTILKKIKIIDKKIKNSNLSIKKYTSIYNQTQELYESLLKTKQDLITIENRLNSSKLDIKIFTLQKNIEVYNLYKSLSKI